MSVSRLEADRPDAPVREGVVALVPGKLYLLGGSVALDGRVSWVPTGTTGWQPINAYLLMENGHALIVDPGIYAHRAIILRQMEALVAAGSVVNIYLTRAEPDAAGNIGEIASRYRVETLFAGGGPNPFDAFESAFMLDPERRADRVQMERLPPGYQIPLGDGRGLEVLRPIIRLLSTYWAYDPQTRTLFTSDSFSHVLQGRPDGTRVTREASVEPAEVKAHLLAKFAWLEKAKTLSIARNFMDLRSGRAIDRIAPGRGLVIEGREAVGRHLDAMQSVLEDLSS